MELAEKKICCAMVPYCGKGWCFTKFWDPAEPFLPQEFLQRVVNSGIATYAVGQVEMAPETGRLHLQGYLQLGVKNRLTWVKKHVDGDAHWEPTRGTPKEARDYCMKEETRVDGPWEFGDISISGKTRGLDRAVEMVKQRATDTEIAEEMPAVWVRHYKGLVELRRALKITAEQRTEPPEIWILWGPSGTGKSRFAKECWPDAFWKAPNNQWWDGYWGQDTVVLDDFTGRWMSLTDCQRLMDPNPLHVEIKGSMVPLVAKRLVFTSNYHPDTWYAKDEHGTIMRRVRDWCIAQGHFYYLPALGEWCDGETREPCSAPVRQGFGNTSETSALRPGHEERSEYA
nr:MAG: replication-associated protein [Cressdnaviricota sp.]